MQGQKQWEILRTVLRAMALFFGRYGIRKSEVVARANVARWNGGLGCHKWGT